MATINKGITGGINGQIGSIVGYSNRGKSVIRSTRKTPVSQVGTTLMTRQALLKNMIDQLEILNQGAITRNFTNIQSSWKYKQNMIFNICNKIDLNDISRSRPKSYYPYNTGGLLNARQYQSANDGTVIFSWNDLDIDTPMNFPCRFNYTFIGINNNNFKQADGGGRPANGSLTLAPNVSTAGLFYLFQAVLYDNAQKLQIQTLPIIVQCT